MSVYNSVLKSGLIVIGMVFSSVSFSQSTLESEIDNLNLSVSEPEFQQTSNSESTSGGTSNTKLDVGNQIRVLLNPKRSTVLSSGITAKIRKLPVDVGDSFKKGALLASFDCSVLIANKKINQAILLQKSIALDSDVSLLSQGGVSKFDVELSRAEVQQAKASVFKDEVELNQCSLHAPYSGKMVRRGAKVHESISAGTPLVEIIDDSSLEMILHVPSLWVVILKKGTKFKIYVDETQKYYDTEITKINPRIDPGSKTLEIYSKLTSGNEDLKAGMSGNALFD